MDNLIEQYELIKESNYFFENVKPKIKARIYKVIFGVNAKYTWEINYYCKLENEMDVYVPSGPFANSFEEIEIKLSNYLQRFGEAVSWRKNE